MKKIIKYYILTGLFFLIGVSEIFSQITLSTNQNYIHTRTMTNESGSTYLDYIDYFDGLGRLTQSVQAGITPTGKDLITLQQYDDYDRESNTWLPASVSYNYGAYLSPSSLMSLVISTYSNDQKPYTLPIYEATPLNRIREQYGPGSDWHNNNKAVRSSYFPNISSVDTLNCINYTISESSSTDTLITINRVGNYSTNTLFVTRVADEDGNTSFEFKDKLGRVILSRQILRSGSTKNLHDTYYIYDNIGNLRAVLPPLASDAMKTGTSWSNSSSDIIRNYAYLYKFDLRNRNISKRLPGANWIYYVYDNADHLIFSQDGNQRRKSPQEWSFSIPDAYGRTVLTGVCQSIYVGGTSKSIAKGCLNSNIVRATFSTSGTYSGYNLTHDASSMTFLSPTVLTASYFDNYSFRSLSGFSNTALNYESSGLDAVFLKRYGDDTQASEYKHTGLSTGTAVSQIGGSSTMLYCVNYYDSKKRLVQSKATNHLGGIESDYIAYNFIGQPVKERHIHTATSQPTQTEEFTYSYDNAGRLLTTTHKLNSGSVVTISENTYDELGRLLTNKKGGLSGTQLTYSYNVRSWTKSITGSLFSENLYYNETSGGNIPRYNGNISSISWTQSGDSRRYNYGYDGLSRLTSANYTGIGNEQYGTTYSYDKHGNILTLQRYGKTSESTYGLVNNLTMTYNGNQLAGVQEGTGPVSQYSYDANGNMTTDGRKNLAITYNVLNLQQSLSQNGTTVASYTWLADGTKCGVVDNNNNGYDYTGSLIYSRSGSVRTPESIDNGAGRIIYSGGTYNPHYYITDHLGSTRVITDNSGSVVERDDYYPFGGQLAISTYPQLSVNRFKFNGKELQTTGNTGFLDYGARMYDDVIGRWGVVDPMSEDDYWNNPYNYGLNNPIRFIDPNGMQSQDSTQERTLPPVVVKAEGNYNNERVAELIYNLINGISRFGRPINQAFGNDDATFWENFQQGLNQYFLAYLPFQLFLKPNIISSSRGGNNIKSIVNEKVRVIRSLKDLMKYSKKMPNVKGGGQRSFEGNIDQIFNSLTKGGKRINPNQIKLSDGTIITKYPAKSGNPTLQINKEGKITKIRIK